MTVGHDGSDAVAAELLATLGDVASLVLLDLGPPGLLLGLKLQPAHVLAGLPDTLPGSHQSTVGLSLSHLGAHDPLAGLNNARVNIADGTVAKGSVKDAAVAGIGRPTEDAAARVAVRRGTRC